MERSGSIKELTAALVRAQLQMTFAVKDSTNPAYRSRYADLTSILDAVKRPLGDNGLAYVQATEIDPEGGVIVETSLLHTSGEYISSRLRMVPVRQDPQGIGSCITYGRRYGLQSLVGIPTDDDDGNAASGKDGNAGATGQRGNRQTAAETGDRPMAENGGNLLSSAQLRLIYLTAARELHIGEKELEERCNTQYGRLPMHLTRAEASEFIEALKAMAGAPSQPATPAPTEQSAPPSDGAAEARQWVHDWLERIGRQESPTMGKRGEELRSMMAHLEGGMPKERVPGLCRTLHEAFTGERVGEGTLVGELLDPRLILALKAADGAALTMLARVARGL